MNIQSTIAHAIVTNAAHMTGAERIAEKVSLHRTVTDSSAVYHMTDRSRVLVKYERSPKGHLHIASIEAKFED